MYMSGDSAGVSGLNVSIRKDSKIFKRVVSIVLPDKDEEINHCDILIGFIISFRMGQILMYCDLPKFTQDTDPYEYMVKTFVHHMINVFKKEGYLRRYDSEKSKDQKKGGTFLVAIMGRLFAIQDDFQVAELHSDFDSVGCGGVYARTALQVLDEPYNEHMPIMNRMGIASQVTETNSGGVSSPWNTIQTTYTE